MDEATATTFRGVFEDMLLEAENKVKYYRRILGKPPVESNADCTKEIESLKSQLQEKTKELGNLQQYVAQQKSKNEVLHRKINDLSLKLCGAYRKRDELAEKLRKARAEGKTSKAELYDEIIEDASDCLVGEVLGIKHEPNDLEPDEMFYFLRITKDEAYRIDTGGYAHLEVWED